MAFTGQRPFTDGQGMRGPRSPLAQSTAGAALCGGVRALLVENLQDGAVHSDELQGD